MLDALHSFIDLIDRLGLEHVFLALMAPVFIVCMVIEGRVLARWHRQTYTTADVLCNVTLALTAAVTDTIAWAVTIGLFFALYEHRLFDIPVTWWSVLLLVVGQDFLYYWFHRAHHRVRWMWASHVAHHSSEQLNLSTALRQSVTYPISGMWAFWLPLAWVGFKPQHVALTVAANLAYQFFVHTETIGKLPGWVEAIFNTPSHHRVHHARNPQYIDRNYAGALIIWDKLFGTFEPECEPCEYGIVHQIHTRNPVVMMFHEWRDMFADFASPGPLGQRLKHLWKPPGWERPA